jgi:UDP-3-O-[3-hydroxymyristoyl] glucosamine N-acyltransferase
MPFPALARWKTRPSRHARRSFQKRLVRSWLKQGEAFALAVFLFSQSSCHTSGAVLSAGHNAILHACTVEDEAFVGMGATLLDGVTVEKGAMVAAGSLVTQKTTVPAGEVSHPQTLINKHCFAKII